MRGHGGGPPAHTLASCIGGVKLLLKVVELLGVVGVGGGGSRPPAHDRGVFVVPVAGTPHPAGRQGLGGVRSPAPAGRWSAHTHRRGFGAGYHHGVVAAAPATTAAHRATHWTVVAHPWAVWTHRRVHPVRATHRSRIAHRSARSRSRATHRSVRSHWSPGPHRSAGAHRSVGPHRSVRSHWATRAHRSTARSVRSHWSTAAHWYTSSGPTRPHWSARAHRPHHHLTRVHSRAHTRSVETTRRSRPRSHHSRPAGSHWSTRSHVSAWSHWSVRSQRHAWSSRSHRSVHAHRTIHSHRSVHRAHWSVRHHGSIGTHRAHWSHRPPGSHWPHRSAVLVHARVGVALEELEAGRTLRSGLAVRRSRWQVVDRVGSARFHRREGPTRHT